MQTPKLQANKVRNFIRQRGVRYKFIRPRKSKHKEPIFDDYGNPLADVTNSARGIFHETGTHFIMVTSTAAQVQRKPKPSILAMWDSIGGIAVGDYLTVPHKGGKWYKVTSINDIGNLRLFAEISLEVIADGVSV